MNTSVIWDATSLMINDSNIDTLWSDKALNHQGKPRQHHSGRGSGFPNAPHRSGNGKNHLRNDRPRSNFDNANDAASKNQWQWGNRMVRLEPGLRCIVAGCTQRVSKRGFTLCRTDYRHASNMPAGEEMICTPCPLTGRERKIIGTNPGQDPDLRGFHDDKRRAKMHEPARSKGKGSDHRKGGKGRGQQPKKVYSTRSSTFKPKKALSASIVKPSISPSQCQYIARHVAHNMKQPDTKCHLDDEYNVNAVTASVDQGGWNFTEWANPKNWKRKRDADAALPPQVVQLHPSVNVERHGGNGAMHVHVGQGAEDALQMVSEVTLTSHTHDTHNPAPCFQPGPPELDAVVMTTYSDPQGGAQHKPKGEEQPGQPGKAASKDKCQAANPYYFSQDTGLPLLDEYEANLVHREPVREIPLVPPFFKSNLDPDAEPYIPKL